MKGKTLKERGKQTKGSAWLKEGEADEPLDFLDSSVTHRIIGKWYVLKMMNNYFRLFYTFKIESLIMNYFVILIDFKFRQ